MNHIISGLKSHSLAIAMLLGFILTISSMSFARMGLGSWEADLPPVEYQWSVKINLSCPMSAAGSYSAIPLFMGTEAFKGCSDEIFLHAGGKSLTYVLAGPGPELPANAAVAHITVVDTDCGGTRHFIVQTDGSGTILILDEL